MRLYIAGHQGMVGSALVRRFQREPGTELVLRTRAELNLEDGAKVRDFFLTERPDTAIIAAAKVGGIHANRTYPADFLRINLAIALHTIEGAREAGTRRLLFFGSSCIYPQRARQPSRRIASSPGPSNRRTRPTPSPRSRD